MRGWTRICSPRSYGPQASRPADRYQRHDRGPPARSRLGPDLSTQPFGVSAGCRRPQKPPGTDRGSAATGTIAALLRDLASVQTSQHSRWGYQRAAAAIRNLEVPIESLLQPDGTLCKIPHVGPSSTRVIMEVLNTGHSETVERLIAA